MWVLEPNIDEGDIIAIQSTNKLVKNRKWKYDVGRFINRTEGFLEVILLDSQDGRTFTDIPERKSLNVAANLILFKIASRDLSRNPVVLNSFMQKNIIEAMYNGMRDDI